MVPTSAIPGGDVAFWRPDLSTGIPEIDGQHRELLSQIAALGEASRTGDVSRAEEILAYLERYAADHFATEERIMWGFGYPDREAHWSLHLGFAIELAGRKASHAANRAEAPLLVDLAEWMDRWLNEHVLRADAEMARFIRHARARRVPV
jgi:hemerythrin